MKIPVALFFVMLMFIMSMFIGIPSHAADFPEIEGWTRTGEIRTYDAGNLWELINGAAEQFLSYDFQFLRSSDLASGDLVVTVEIYDMKTPLNAFGIYTAQIPGGAERLSIGADAVVSPPYQCLMLKQHFFIKVEAYTGNISETAGKVLLEAIANALPGSNAPPGELGMLPEAGRVKGSEGFSRRSFLGLADLENCVFAGYSGETGKEYRVFFIVPGPGETVSSMWRDLEARWKPVGNDGHPVLARKVPYSGSVGVILTERGIFGVSDCPDDSRIVERLKRVIP